MSASQHRDSERYEVRVEGHLDPAPWFDGMTLTSESDGTTHMHGPVMDQAALHGLLEKLRDVGLPLVSVTRIERDQPDLRPRSSPPAALTRRTTVGPSGRRTSTATGTPGQ
jgi:hypothetical protein